MAVNLLVPLLIPLNEEFSNSTQSPEILFKKSTFEFEIKENLVIKEPILRLQNYLHNEEEKVKYFIKGAIENLPFRINSKGNFHLKTSFDYEKANFYDIKIGVIWSKRNEFESEIDIVVKVRDENEFNPVFERKIYETQVTEEERLVPRKILQVRAMDLDGGVWGNLTYKIDEEVSNFERFYDVKSNLFRINETSGEVFLLKSLDRDPPNGTSQWRFKVNASDGQLSDVASVIVNVKDVNDNAPRFLSPIVVATVHENEPKGSFVAQVSCEDIDDPNSQNSKVSFSLGKNLLDERTNQELFSIDAVNGTISTNVCCLDREKTPAYSLQVIATDGGGLKGTATVEIQILDDNDVRPKFSRKNWILKVKENSYEPSKKDRYFVGTITVIDPDVTNNFSYRILSKSMNEIFEIERKSEGTGACLYSKVPLDYENENHRNGFEFQVEVVDQAVSSLEHNARSATSWVKIIVMNENDNEPIFVENYLEVYVQEDAEIGPVLVSLKALDEDWGDESIVKYEIRSINDVSAQLFVVNDLGEVSLAHHLDRERLSWHLLKVMAVDSGQPRLTATATIQVHVIDSNDNPPHITSGLRHEILENSKPQTVGEFKVGDLDDVELGNAGPFFVEIDSSASKSIVDRFGVYFDPDTSIGYISTLKELDREHDNIWAITLFARDAGGLATILNVYVEVLDVNDNPMMAATKYVVVNTLQFLSPWYKNVPLGKVFVHDLDGAVSPSVSVQWKSETESADSNLTSNFNLISKSGELFMTKNMKPGRYELEFLVSDTFRGEQAVNSKMLIDVNEILNVYPHNIFPILVEASPKTLLTKYYEETGLSKLDHLVRILQQIAQQYTYDKSHNNENNNSNSNNKKNNNNHKVENSENASKAVKNPEINILTVQSVYLKEVEVTKIWFFLDRFPSKEILWLMRNEIENQFGYRIIELGLPSCTEQKKCQGKGCWATVQIQPDFSIIDVGHASIAGPRIEILSGCGCKPPSYLSFFNLTDLSLHNLSEISKKNQLNFRPKTDTLLKKSKGKIPKTVKSIYENVCVPNPCFNGGKCLPAADSYRCVCLNDTAEPYCKVLSRKFSEKKYSIESKFSNGVFLSSFPTCSNVHISIEFKTIQENAVLIYAGSSNTDVFKHSSSKAFKRYESNNVIFSALSKVLHFDNIKNNSIFSEGEIKTNTAMSENNFLPLKEVKREKYFKEEIKLKHMNLFQDLNKKLNKFPESDKGNLNLQINARKDVVMRLHEIAYLSDLHSDSNRKSYASSILNKTKFENVPSHVKKLSKWNTNSAIYKTKTKFAPTVDSKTFSESKYNSNKQEIEKISDKFLVEIIQGRLSLKIDLGDGLININMNESSWINDGLWHRLDVFWDAKSIQAIIDLCEEVNTTAHNQSNFIHRSAEKNLKIVENVIMDSHNLNSHNTKLRKIKTSSELKIQRKHYVNYSTDLHFNYGYDDDNIRLAKKKSKNIKNKWNLKSISSCRAVVFPDGPSRQLNLKGFPVILGDFSSEMRKLHKSLSASFMGCMRNIRVNSKLQDLGTKHFNEKIETCHTEANVCSKNSCKTRKNGEICENSESAENVSCLTQETQITLSLHSHMSFFLNSSLSFRTEISFRFRTRSETGNIITVECFSETLNIRIFDGHLCIVLVDRKQDGSVCLNEIFLNDGRWHFVEALRVKYFLILKVDDGDDKNYNFTILEGKFRQLKGFEDEINSNNPEGYTKDIWNVRNNLIDVENVENKSFQKKKFASNKENIKEINQDDVNHLENELIKIKYLENSLKINNFYKTKNKKLLDKTNKYNNEDKTNKYNNEDKTNKYNNEDKTNKYNNEDKTNKYNNEDKTNKYNNEDKTNNYNNEDKTNKYNNEDKTNKYNNENASKTLKRKKVFRIVQSTKITLGQTNQNNFVDGIENSFIGCIASVKVNGEIIPISVEMSDKKSDTMLERKSDTISGKKSDTMSDRVLKKKIDEKSDTMSERKSGKKWDTMSEKTSDKTPKRPPFGVVRIIKRRHIQTGCRHAKVCDDEKCPAPLHCIDDWNEFRCGCASGERLSDSGEKCLDTNECDWQPCLNGGSCLNKSPGYVCVCESGFQGSNCENVSVTRPYRHHPHIGLISAAITCSILLLILIITALLLRKYHIGQKKRRKESSSQHFSAELENIPKPLLKKQKDNSDETELQCNHSIKNKPGKINVNLQCKNVRSLRTYEVGNTSRAYDVGDNSRGYVGDTNSREHEGRVSTNVNNLLDKNIDVSLNSGNNIQLRGYNLPELLTNFNFRPPIDVHST